MDAAALRGMSFSPKLRSFTPLTSIDQFVLGGVWHGLGYHCIVWALCNGIYPIAWSVSRDAYILYRVIGLEPCASISASAADVHLELGVPAF